MSKNWAIVIGINTYNPNNFSSLKYAKQDAESVRDFFLREAKFDEVCFFSNDSADFLWKGNKIPTQPTYGNLISFLHDRFETKPFLSAGDNCWFFFAGHGEQHANQDYLMPQDANPRSIQRTAIPVNYVRERLSRSGADNVILILDACRTDGSRGAAGIGSETQQGAIVISSCSPTQKAWEIDELEHGAFTYALLEGLRMRGELNCATVERLDLHLRRRVPELCQKYDKYPEQNPRTAVDPADKLYSILVLQQATQADVTLLNNDPLEFEAEKDVELAEQPLDYLAKPAMISDGIGTINLSTNFHYNLLRSFQGHQESVVSIAFSADCLTLSSVGSDSTVHLWCLESSSSQRLQCSLAVKDASYSPSGQRLAIWSSSHVQVMTMPEAKKLQVLAHPSIKAVSFSPKESVLASAGGAREGTVRLWDVETNSVKATFYHEATVHSIAFTSDGQILAAGSSNKIVRLWCIKDQKYFRELYLGGTACSIVFTSNNQFLFVGASDGNIVCWRINGKKEHEVKCHSDYINSIVIDSKEQLLFSASDDCTVSIWQLPHLRHLETLQHDSAVKTLAVPKKQNMVASGSSNGKIQLWTYSNLQ